MDHWSHHVQRNLSFDELAAQNNAFEVVIAALLPESCKKSKCFVKIDENGECLFTPRNLDKNVFCTNGHIDGIHFSRQHGSTGVGGFKCHGSLPSEIGGLLSLNRIILQDCPVRSSLPTEIGRLSYLGEIDFFSHLRSPITGSFPTEIGALWSLHSIKLHGETSSKGLNVSERNKRRHMSIENIGASIPTELGRATWLHEATFESIRLSGTIPTELGNIGHSFIEIDFQWNNLVGTIPSEFSRFQNLDRMLLEENLLIGKVPTELGRLSSIYSFSVAKNHLEGPIEWMTDLSKLRRLSVEYNSLDGSLPATIAKCHRLNLLFGHGNRFTGEIPTEIGLLHDMQTLQLGANQLRGSIPNQLSKLQKAMFLGLHRNSLEGSIPSEVSAESFVFVAWSELLARRNSIRLS